MKRSNCLLIMLACMMAFAVQAQDALPNKQVVEQPTHGGKLVRERMATPDTIPVHVSLPDTPILMTTPPGSYDSTRKGRRRRTYAVNPRTQIAVETIHRFAAQHRLAVCDMYATVGGSKNACRNWQAAQLMRPDHVHYVPEAYRLQGELLYDALIKAYNDYISR